MYEIELKSYKKNWVNLFQKEAQIINKFLNGNIISLIHVGSTSIEDIKAKEIIDIAVCMDKIISKGHLKLQFLDLNYIDIAYFEHENYIILGSKDKKFNLHIGAYDNNDIINLLLFKLYISMNQDYKDFYISLKEEIIERSEPQLYEINKTNFVNRVIHLAKLAYLSGNITENDFDIIFKNSFTYNKEKMIKAITQICIAEKEESKDDILNYRQLHKNYMDLTKKDLENSPFLLKFEIKNMNDMEIELSQKHESILKNMMSQTLIRQFMLNRIIKE